MTYDEYLVEVNKTWKNDSVPNMQIHAKLALLEETGEIAGWYKKHHGYGRPKDEKWKAELKGEFGDLLYYIVKYTDLYLANKPEIEDLKSFFTDKGLRESKLIYTNAQDVVDSIGHIGIFLNILTKSHAGIPLRSSARSHYLFGILIHLNALIEEEGWTLEEIQESNIAKLRARHGMKFSENAIFEKGRNRDVETEALSKSKL